MINALTSIQPLNNSLNNLPSFFRLDAIVRMKNVRVKSKNDFHVSVMQIMKMFEIWIVKKPLNFLKNAFLLTCLKLFIPPDI